MKSETEGERQNQKGHRAGERGKTTTGNSKRGDADGERQIARG
jgi:hypothetical protein